MNKVRRKRLSDAGNDHPVLMMAGQRKEGARK